MQAPTPPPKNFAHLKHFPLAQGFKQMVKGLPGPLPIGQLSREGYWPKSYRVFCQALIVRGKNHPVE